MDNKPNYWRTQSAVVPFRVRKGKTQVLLVTSRNKKRWTIPKGTKEPYLSAQQSAAKEALEEAGLKGRVTQKCMGVFHYRKWGGICRVEVFAMEVVKVFDDWDEDDRDRQWLSLNKAIARVDRKGLQRIMESLPGFLERQSVAA